MSYTMYTPLNVWLDPASVTDVVAYIQNYLSENTIYSEEEIEGLIHDYLIAHPELIGGVQSVNGKTGTVVLSASDINTENNVTIESVLASLSSQISSIAASVATNTANITSLTGRVSTAETDISNLKSSLEEITGGTRNVAYLEQGTLNISNGAEQDSTTRCRTNFIPIDTTTNLYITRGLWSVRNGIGYDANKQFVASNQFLSDAYADEGRPFRVTNTNIKYVRFIYSASNTSQNVTPDYGPFMVEVGEKTGYYVPFETAVDYEARAQIAEVKATPPNHLEMLCEGFDHVAVIGDSLITGTTLNASAVAKSDLKWSWVKRLAVRSGNDWTPYGRSGLTLQTWLTDSAGLPALQNGTTPDVIVVSLGTNDAVGNNYISAFTTNYGTLLDTLHTNFPNALILCLPLWNFAASRTLEYQNTSAAIQTVCESRNFAFFVSMVTYDATLKNDYFTQSRISAHYNSLAYAWISDIIAFCIGEVIESNPTAFTYINFING